MNKNITNQKHWIKTLATNETFTNKEKHQQIKNTTKYKKKKTSIHTKARNMKNL